MALPLSEIRVIDLSRVLAGPYCTMMLADLGADVIKVEQPGSGDLSRSITLHSIDHESAYFASVNRNKRSLTLDLGTEKARGIFYRLVHKSDVVLDNFRPGVLERLGCDYQTLVDYNRKIISCSITGFGSSGPYRDLPSYDLIVQALGGGMSITGEPGGPPVRAGIPIGDLAGGLTAAFAVCAALHSRDSTGQGQQIDVSLLDCQVSLLTYVAQYYFVSGEVPGPIGSGHQWYVPYQAFATMSSFIVIAVFGEGFWTKLCSVLDLPGLADDPRFCSGAKRNENRDVLLPILQEVLLTKDAEAWIEQLCQAGIPAAPVNNVAEVFENPQVIARNMVCEMNWPPGSRTKVVGNPVKLLGQAEHQFRPPPGLGEHSEEILSSVLDCSSEEIQELKLAKTI